MTKKEKIKAFFNKHKEGFIVGSVGFVSFIAGAVAVIKSKKYSSCVDIKTVLDSAIERSYEENREVTWLAYSEDDDHLIYESKIKVSTECIGD